MRLWRPAPPGGTMCSRAHEQMISLPPPEEAKRSKRERAPAAEETRRWLLHGPARRVAARCYHAGQRCSLPVPACLPWMRHESPARTPEPRRERGAVRQKKLHCWSCCPAASLHGDPSGACAGAGLVPSSREELSSSRCFHEPANTVLLPLPFPSPLHAVVVCVPPTVVPARPANRPNRPRSNNPARIELMHSSGCRTFHPFSHHGNP